LSRITAFVYSRITSCSSGVTTMADAESIDAGICGVAGGWRLAAGSSRERPLAAPQRTAENRASKKRDPRRHADRRLASRPARRRVQRHPAAPYTVCTAENRERVRRVAQRGPELLCRRAVAESGSCSRPAHRCSPRRNGALAAARALSVARA
jgi:hypothetical protein